MTFEEFAKEQGLHVEATAIPFRPDREELDDSPEYERPVHFLAVLRKANGKVVWQGYYTMGCYHVIRWAKGMLQDEKSKAKLEHLLLKHSRGSPDKVTLHDVEKLCDSAFGWSDHDRKVARVIRRAFAGAAQVPVGGLLECLASEWRSVENTDCFEDWAEEHGYDHSVSALEKYLKLCRDRAKAKRALGTAWETLMQIEEE